MRLYFRSLRARLILVLLLLLCLLATATGVATLKTMQRDSQQQAEQMLSVSAKILREMLNNRAALLSSSVKVLAADFAFRRAVATAEQETIESVLSNHGGRIDANLMLLLGPDGNLLASSDQQLSAADIAPLFQQTTESSSEPVTDMLLLSGRPYQLVLAPVKAPTLIAWVGMGFLLDQPLTQQIKAISSLDVSFASILPEQHRIAASTLDVAFQQQLASQLTDITLKHGISVDDIENDYASLALPLDQQQQLYGVVHLSNQRWRASYQEFRQQLLLIFGAALSLSLLAGVLLARSITGPLNKLTEFAKRIGQGLTVSEPPAGSDEVGTLGRTLVTMQQDILQREQQLIFSAEHDSLTGCFNRNAAEHLLQHCLEQCDGSLVQLNIQQFKSVNEVLGFSNGDVLLQQLAQRLKHITPAPLLLARLGGDEFLLAYPQPQFAQQVQQLIKPLLPGYTLQGSTINLKLSAGIYNFAKSQLSVNDALRRADIALNNARTSPDGLAFYQQGQDESHQRELALIRDIPVALENGDFFVVYQPKVDIKLRRCTSAEALIRWQHPTLGLIAPDQFIALAEHSGNIGLISQWMLKQVIAQAATWWRGPHPMQLAVNLSVSDLLDTSLADTISHQLAQHKLPAAALALEVTESAVMEDADTVIHQLQRLRDLGITLSIDDFGTGQSSLAYLKRLPVHEVKIDRAFVKDIEHNANDALIVSATTQLAKSLGFSVTAEGLENAAGLSYLLQCDCDKVQGYYFSKPISAAQLEQWLPKLATYFPRSEDSL